MPRGVIAALPRTGNPAARRIGALAARALRREADLHPKPGLVSRIDSGAHRDMDAALLRRSASTLAPWFARLADLGMAGAEMASLRAAGIAAEQAMMAATGGVNTHRGAIFGLGLLAAAAGWRSAHESHGTLGAIVAGRWARGIGMAPVALGSHGSFAYGRYGAGGARAEAAAGFPSVYRIGLPALRDGRAIAGRRSERALVHACMALIAEVEDTNLLYRGGIAGLDYARRSAAAFMAAGGVAQAEWRDRAIGIHHAFVARNLSPGGAADLLAITLFLDDCEEGGA